MKLTYLSPLLTALCLSAAIQAQAQDAATYILTITNGSLMPLSPGVVYVKNGNEPSAAIGSTPTSGFIQLCQMGLPAQRLTELKSDMTVSSAALTEGPILPGETRSLEVTVMNPSLQGIHLETMYGKSKDTCGVASVNSHSLVALKQHVTPDVIVKDNTTLTGAFNDPALPMGMLSPDQSVCPNSMNAISCLRELATPNMRAAKIRNFANYSPRVISALEMKYGSAEAQTLAFPASGAILLKLKLKH